MESIRAGGCNRSASSHGDSPHTPSNVRTFKACRTKVGPAHRLNLEKAVNSSIDRGDGNGVSRTGAFR